MLVHNTRLNGSIHACLIVKMLTLNKGFLFYKLCLAAVEKNLQRWNLKLGLKLGACMWVFSNVSVLGLLSLQLKCPHSQHCTCTCSSAISGCDHCSHVPTDSPLNSGADGNSLHILSDWKCALQESNAAALLCICACINKWQSKKVILPYILWVSKLSQFFFFLH